MKKQASVNDICTTKVENDAEKIFTSSIFVPLTIACAAFYGLYLMVEDMRANVSPPRPYYDQFKEIWWSGPIFFSIAYLLMVYFGPKLMESRKEFRIKPYIFVYNSYQCILNFLTVAGMIYEVYSNPWFKYPWGNTVQRDINGFRIAVWVWIHYNNKFSELLDTLWMILRKKKEQLSFLHCYHHILMMWAWFFCVRIDTGGDVYFGACVNSFIHVIMYGYYTLALLNIPCPWKKWITNCQMIQFMACLSHSIFVVYNKNMPIALPLNQGFVMVNMLVLFSQFYAKSYGGKKKGGSDGNGAKKTE